MSRRTYLLMSLATFLSAMTIVSAAASASPRAEPTPPEYTLTQIAVTQVTETCELRAYELASAGFIKNVAERVFVIVCKGETPTIGGSK